MSLDPATVRNAAEPGTEDEYISSLADVASNVGVAQLQNELSQAVGGNRTILRNLANNIRRAPDAASAPLRSWANTFVDNEARVVPPLQPSRAINAPPLATVRGAPPPLPSRSSQPGRAGPPPLPDRRLQPRTAATATRPRMSNDASNAGRFKDYFAQDVARRSTKFRLTKFQSVIGLVGTSALVAAAISLVVEQNRSPTKQKKGLNIFAIVAAVIGSVGAFYSISQLMQRDVPTVEDVYAASY